MVIFHSYLRLPETILQLTTQNHQQAAPVVPFKMPLP
jgi:hypothetical protein